MFGQLETRRQVIAYCGISVSLLSFGTYANFERITVHARDRIATCAGYGVHVQACRTGFVAGIEEPPDIVRIHGCSVDRISLL